VSRHVAVIVRLTDFVHFRVHFGSDISVGTKVYGGVAPQTFYLVTIAPRQEVPKISGSDSRGSRGQRTPHFFGQGVKPRLTICQR
jgi:hypothetical protein